MSTRTQKQAAARKIARYILKREKRAIGLGPGAAIGAIGGALRAEPGERWDGAGRGAVRGGITGLGADIGATAGMIPGLAKLLQQSQKRFVTPKDQREALLLLAGGGLVGGLAGGGLGHYAGGKLTRKRKRKNEKRAVAQAVRAATRLAPRVGRSMLQGARRLGRNKDWAVPALSTGTGAVGGALGDSENRLYGAFRGGLVGAGAAGGARAGYRMFSPRGGPGSNIGGLLGIGAGGLGGASMADGMRGYANAWANNRDFREAQRQMTAAQEALLQHQKKMRSSKTVEQLIREHQQRMQEMARREAELSQQLGAALDDYDMWEGVINSRQRAQAARRRSRNPQLAQPQEDDQQQIRRRLERMEARRNEIQRRTGY